MTTASGMHNKIQTLRVKTSGGAKPALRFSLMQTFASLDLHPAGMAPSAIFMIRHLEDPLPGSLADKSRKNSAWQSALRNTLDVLYRQAARPVDGWVGGNPPAVVFRDQSEMLACLLFDISQQQLGQHWWWRRRNFSSPYISQRIREVLLNDARYIPAIFSHLTRGGKALQVVMGLEPTHANDILQAMLGEFSLAGILSSRPDEERQPHPHGSPPDDYYEHSSPSLPSQLIPPWKSLFSAEIWRADLRPEQAALLGIAYTLHQRPAIIRNRIFQHRITEWWVKAIQSEVRHAAEISPATYKFPDLDLANAHDRGKATSSNIDAQIEVAAEVENLSSNRQSTQLDPLLSHELNYAQSDIITDDEVSPPFIHELHESRGRARVGIQNGSAPAESRIQFSTQDQAGPAVLRKLDTEWKTSNTCASSRNEHIDTEGDNSVATAHTEVHSRGLSEEHLEDDLEVNPHFSNNWIDTRLGGIVFLINLLQQLGLPHDFDENWGLGRQLGPWALVDSLARALLGKEFSALYDDPIWRVLAKLDGRRTKWQIANKFSAKADYHLPLAWYQWLHAEKLYWATWRNQIRIWTETCVLAETTFSGDAYTSCLANLQLFNLDSAKICLQRSSFREAPMEIRAHLRACGMNPDLARLFALITPFVRRFLAEQLQMQKAHKRDPVRELLLLDSRLYLSSSHIDLVASIEHSRFKLRCAGLDQDPGWQPDYGRVVLIHFS